MVGNVNLKIDCSRLSPQAIHALAGVLGRYVDVVIAGGDLIFATGKVDSHVYTDIWRILRGFDVDID